VSPKLLASALHRTSKSGGGWGWLQGPGGLVAMFVSGPSVGRHFRSGTLEDFYIPMAQNWSVLVSFDVALLPNPFGGVFCV